MSSRLCPARTPRMFVQWGKQFPGCPVLQPQGSPCPGHYLILLPGARAQEHQALLSPPSARTGRWGGSRGASLLPLCNWGCARDPKPLTSDVNFSVSFLLVQDESRRDRNFIPSEHHKCRQLCHQPPAASWHCGTGCSHGCCRPCPAPRGDGCAGAGEGGPGQGATSPR